MRLIAYVGKFYSLIREYLTDMYLFAKFNGHSPLEHAQRKHFYHIIIKTHTIEKGLSLLTPRPMFGQDKINEVLLHLKSYDEQFSTLPVGMAQGALKDYITFNKPHTEPSNPILEDIDRSISACGSYDPSQIGGIRKIRDLSAYKGVDFIEFLKHRFSCRSFSTEPIPVEIIQNIVQTANRAPSQCNRQSVRLHFYQQKEQIDSLLTLQGGTRGFTETIGNLFVITSEITAWGGPQQRNQLYVDGGLYAMMLMLALQAHGFLSCPLNLAVGNVAEKSIKSTAAIPERQRLIMMIAAGKPASEEFSVARSPRLFSSEVLTVH